MVHCRVATGLAPDSDLRDDVESVVVFEQIQIFTLAPERILPLQHRLQRPIWQYFHVSVMQACAIGHTESVILWGGEGREPNPPGQSQALYNYTGHCQHYETGGCARLSLRQYTAGNAYRPSEIKQHKGDNIATNVDGLFATTGRSLEDILRIVRL